MTVYTLIPFGPPLGLDCEDRRALAVLAQRAAALAPFLRPALVVRLQLAGILVAYLLAGMALAAGLSSLLGRL